MIQQTLDLMDGFMGMDNGFSRGDLTGLFLRIGKFDLGFQRNWYGCGNLFFRDIEWLYFWSVARETILVL